MASKNKIKKLKNSYSVKSWLKNKTIKLKRGGFFTPSNRQKLKGFDADVEEDISAAIADNQPLFTTNVGSGNIE